MGDPPISVLPVPHQENVQLVFDVFVFGICISDIFSQRFCFWYVFGLSLSLKIYLCLCKLYLCVFEKDKESLVLKFVLSVFGKQRNNFSEMSAEAVKFFNFKVSSSVKLSQITLSLWAIAFHGIYESPFLLVLVPGSKPSTAI